MEKIIVLTAYRTRLLVRDRRKLIAVLALPLLVALLLGIAADDDSRIAAAGLFAVLLTSTILLMVTGLRTDGLLPPTSGHRAGSVLERGSEVLAGLAVLVAQSALYSLLASLLGAGAPGIGTIAFAILISVAVGIAASVLLPRICD